MKASAIIKNTIASVLAQAQPVDFRSRSACLSNLTFVYHTMRASENLLRLAVANTEPGPLYDYFVEHLAEEKGHAEWLAGDLHTVGIEAANTPVPRQAVEMVGTQYYLIQHLGSAALLGYMVLMECFSMPLAHVETLEVAHGKDLILTIRYHAEHDIDHGADVLDMIDSLTPKQQALALESGVQAARYFICAMATFR
jgi:hypothetical protein